MNQHKHNDPHHDPKHAAYKGFGAILFYCGFVSGILAAGALLYGEMTKMNKSLFEALADRKSTRLNSSHVKRSRMPSSA